MRPAFEVECQHKFRCRLQALPSRLKNPIHCSEHGQVKRKLNAAIFGESHARNCGSRSGTGARGGWFQLGTTNLRASRRSSFDQANPPDSLEILLEFSPMQKPNGPTRMDPYIMTPMNMRPNWAQLGLAEGPLATLGCGLPQSSPFWRPLDFNSASTAGAVLTSSMECRKQSTTIFGHNATGLRRRMES